MQPPDCEGEGGFLSCGKVTVKAPNAKYETDLRPTHSRPRRTAHRLRIIICLASAAACGPTARIPSPLPLDIPDAIPPADSSAWLARTLAPVLYIHPDERFPLVRVVAVVHPSEPLIAYHLLWRDDVHGAWLPFTVPTDQEIIWVRYDQTLAPVELITYWHGSTLHADWRNKGYAAIDVQWGKHGAMPRAIVESDLPNSSTLNLFYAFTWLGLPDIWLSAVQRPGPLCFCGSYPRYREFTREVPLWARIDAVVRTDDPDAALTAVFGRRYSRKTAWPPQSMPSRTLDARAAASSPD